MKTERLEPVDILLVEDNPYDLELGLRALKENHIGNRVEIARNGIEALEYLASLGLTRNGYSSGNRPLPKLILLDLKLPKVSGLEVLRRIRETKRGKEVPVVVLTSSQEESDIIESYHLGVNSYIVKPLDFDQFRKTVRQLGMYWMVMNRLPGKEC